MSFLKEVEIVKRAKEKILETINSCSSFEQLQTSKKWAEDISIKNEFGDNFLNLINENYKNSLIVLHNNFGDRKCS